MTINCTGSGKVMIICLIAGSIKMILLHKMSYFLEQYIHYKINKNKIQIELDLSDCATKSDLKSARGIDASNFAKKTDLANSKSNVDKLNI